MQNNKFQSNKKSPSLSRGRRQLGGLRGWAGRAGGRQGGGQRAGGGVPNCTLVVGHGRQQLEVGIQDF